MSLQPESNNNNNNNNIINSNNNNNNNNDNENNNNTSQGQVMADTGAHQPPYPQPALDYLTGLVPEGMTEENANIFIRECYIYHQMVASSNSWMYYQPLDGTSECTFQRPQKTVVRITKDRRFERLSEASDWDPEPIREDFTPQMEPQSEANNFTTLHPQEMVHQGPNLFPQPWNSPSNCASFLDNDMIREDVTQNMQPLSEVNNFTTVHPQEMVHQGPSLFPQPWNRPSNNASFLNDDMIREDITPNMQPLSEANHSTSVRPRGMFRPCPDSFLQAWGRPSYLASFLLEGMTREDTTPQMQPQSEANNFTTVRPQPMAHQLPGSLRQSWRRPSNNASFLCEDMTRELSSSTQQSAPHNPSSSENPTSPSSSSSLGAKPGQTPEQSSSPKETLHAGLIKAESQKGSSPAGSSTFVEPLPANGNYTPWSMDELRAGSSPLNKTDMQVNYGPISNDTKDARSSEVQGEKAEAAAAAATPMVVLPPVASTVSDAIPSPEEDNMRMVLIHNLPAHFTLQDVSERIRIGPLLLLELLGPSAATLAASTTTTNGALRTRSARVIFQHAAHARALVAFGLTFADSPATASAGETSPSQSGGSAHESGTLAEPICPRFPAGAQFRLGTGSAQIKSEDLAAMEAPLSARRRIKISRSRLFYQGGLMRFKRALFRVAGGERNVEFIHFYNPGEATVVLTSVAVARRVASWLDQQISKPGGHYEGADAAMVRDFNEIGATKLWSQYTMSSSGHAQVQPDGREGLFQGPALRW